MVFEHHSCRRDDVFCWKRGNRLWRYEPFRSSLGPRDVYVSPPRSIYILAVEDYPFCIILRWRGATKFCAFSPDQSYLSVQMNSNRCSARTFGNNTIIERSNTIETRLVSQTPVACIPSRYFYILHAFDCMQTFDYMHASCITGAIYISDDSNASFGEETVFANNSAERGGTTVTCARFCESQVTTNKTFPARGYSRRAVLRGLWRHTNVL